MNALNGIRLVSARQNGRRARADGGAFSATCNRPDNRARRQALFIVRVVVVISVFVVVRPTVSIMVVV
jgi:hypothetical protein